MQRVLVSSSDIASVGFNVNTNTLEIEFHSGGIYQYSGVTETVFQSLINATSVGRYFHQNIMDQYATTKLR